MEYIVDASGRGDFASIQAAVDAVPSGARGTAVLRVRAGVYREKVVVNKDDLHIVGERADSTVLVWSGCAKDVDADGREKGTFLSYTLLVAGDGVTVENLTVRNDAGDGREVGQAVAVYAAGDRGVWRGCRLIAHQDTLYCGALLARTAADALPRALPAGVREVGDCPPVIGRLYFENCFLQGDVDFIFGASRAWFERCTLFMNARGGYYTAASTPEASPFGFAFHDCLLTGECAAGAAFLGRPWRPFARTVFLNCEMDACVSPRGFTDWDTARPVTPRLGEYGTRGARADQSARHPAQKRLSRAEAEAIDAQAVLAGADTLAARTGADALAARAGEDCRAWWL